MPIVFLIGRVLFVLYFVYGGLQRLMNVAGTAELFGKNFSVPGSLATLMAPVESAVGLSTLQILALLAGAIELFAGLLIAFNVGTRFMAAVLIVFTALVIFYGNDFWNMAAGAREAALVHAILHVSMIGGLLLFVALGSARPGEPERLKDV